MNKQIQQLAEQAGINVSQKNYGYYWVESADGIEKFAELIVKEMLVTCEEHPAWTGRMIGEQIRKHFGVEE